MAVGFPFVLWAVEEIARGILSARVLLRVLNLLGLYVNGDINVVPFGDKRQWLTSFSHCCFCKSSVFRYVLSLSHSASLPAMVCFEWHAVSVISAYTSDLD